MLPLALDLSLVNQECRRWLGWTAVGIDTSYAESGAEEVRQAPVEANPKERKLRENEEDVGKTIKRKIPQRAGSCRINKAKLHKEQIEQERGGECERYGAALAQEQNSHGQFEDDKAQGEGSDMWHHETSPDAAHERIKGRSPELGIDLWAVEGALEMDEAPDEVPE